MNLFRYSRSHKQLSFVLRATVFLGLSATGGALLYAQDAAQGPIAPPPEHHGTRVGAVAEPAAPPSLPEAEIGSHFSQEEGGYGLSRTGYTYRKTMRLLEFGTAGKPS